MSIKRGESWERYGRRFHLRLSYKRPMEKAVMDEFDRRSTLLEKDDKEFLRMCLVVGYQVIAGQANRPLELALSTNESNNTPKEQSASPIESVRAADQSDFAAAETGQESEMKPASGSGVRALAGLLGPARKTQN
ncbi:hypothetical protein [Paraburkholderia sediminicola]|uniref:hypothetical protein n=1 Tax=Paraburkholderia sediminicola TaxID=458836 RepID=UPI0038BB593F